MSTREREVSRRNCEPVTPLTAPRKLSLTAGNGSSPMSVPPDGAGAQRRGYHRHRVRAQRGAVHAAGVTGIEIVAGLAWRRRTGDVPWEYRSGFTVRGVTRLDYAPGWAILGLAAERLDDAMRRR